MATNSANPRFGHDILCPFDVWEDTRDFLADVIGSFGEPAETERLLRLSLTAGAEDWHYLINCAESICRIRGNAGENLDGQDVLTYVGEILNGHEGSPYAAVAWEQTDRLIARAKALEHDPEIRPPSSLALFEQFDKNNSECLASSSPLSNPSKSRVTTSHFWSDQAHDQHSSGNLNWSNTPASFPPTYFTSQQCSFDNYPGLLEPEAASTPSANVEPTRYSLRSSRKPQSVEVQPSTNSATPSVKRSSAVSPFFSSSSPTEEKKSPAKKRPPAGTVATVPFAPLTSSKFGIVQELFAHDPFWLLVAVTFLIKTNGKVAMPVFYKVKERFPTPEHIADESNKDEIVAMIRHLGLSLVRVSFMQKYARGFLERPPRPNVRYRVKNYDHRDVDPSRALDTTGDSFTLADEGNADGYDTWEIGHLTQGKYAIDSWRIFCRDELLGRAMDWNGQGREPEFQPEWMRVMPHDKELRAYLRWMWMREGWEWDPVTGERSVLRDEMLRAVNEGRVEYDDAGGLRILD
ncbi:hypothetical protein B0T10DRAFT_115002 [Thelonectria olida]|uniref:Methyl-CpG-binding domain-containing protein 4 n=1 Tax=Thelonectria olida TaxID=1576542 RepID=A0A9P8WE85_9HYPO|nr:hypothetical protein B0T10DRAFT_115002 [Thelonectria olida]